MTTRSQKEVESYKKAGDILFSCIEITDESFYPKYKFKQELWNYTEFRRLKDLRKYINSIKKDLIGKTLDKILFLNYLNDYIYIISDGIWQSYSAKTKDYKGSYWEYCKNIANPPVVLQFEGNNLEIDVSENAGRCFDGPNYVRLGYNTIKETDKIEKRFCGVNHSVRFKEIIGQKLIKIVTENRCNNIEFQFENGYGCTIYTDTCGDYGTEFAVITPEIYKRIPYRLCAYKNDANSDWVMEILQGDKTNNKFISQYYKDKYKFWKNPITIDYDPKMIKKKKWSISDIALDILNYFESGYNDWIYIKDTDKFYYKDEIVPEPKTESKKADIKVSFDIDLKGIESYFENCISQDNADYDVYCQLKLEVNEKSIKPNIDHGSRLRYAAKKFIKNIENNLPAIIKDFQIQQDILFAYPKENNQLRIVIRGDYLCGARYIFDYTTEKDSFIKQFKKGFNKAQKIQYEVNKRIKKELKNDNK